MSIKLNYHQVANIVLSIGLLAIFTAIVYFLVQNQTAKSKGSALNYLRNQAIDEAIRNNKKEYSFQAPSKLLPPPLGGN